MKDRTQQRLATGLKVSSAIDGAESFFQAKSLSDRTKDLLERKDGMDQGVSLVLAAQNALSGVTSMLGQMKGLVQASAVPSSIDPNQFDEMLNQLNNLVGDSYYQGTNLLANLSSAGEAVTTATHTVEFSEKSDSKVDINGQYAGSSYYLSTGGDAKLIPNDAGTSFSVSNSISTQEAIDSADVQVNTTTAGDQAANRIAALDGGGYVVVWNDANALDGASSGIIGQQYDASGNTIGNEFVINSTTAGNQRNPAVTGLSNGGYVVTWQDENATDGNGIGIFAQRFDSSGSAVGGEFQVNATYTTGDQVLPEITALDDGGFAVTWVNQNNDDGGGYGIYARRFDADSNAVSSEFLVNSTTSGNQNNPRIATLTNGNFIVTWTDENAADGSGSGVFAQRYDSSGTALGSEFQVNTTTANNQQTSGVTGLAGGGFVVTWHEENTQDIYAQVYNSDGSKLGSEFQVNTNTGIQAGPEVSQMSDGGFLVAWVDYNADGASGAIVGRRYDSVGTSISSEFQINTITAGNQDTAEIATLSNGDFVVSWTDGGGADGAGQGIFARRYSLGLTGGSVDGTSVVSTDYSNNQVTADIGGVRQTLTITKQGLGVAHSWYYQDFDTSAGRDQAISDLNSALDTVRGLSFRLGSQISLLQVRSDFTQQYTNDLTEGADKLVLADINEEGANLLALQTRSSLGIQALSFVGQAISNVLSLFR
ncbi:hypothetical protein BEN30_07365 [Magnetovibrio blakemorei]|uniref:Flagellin N-terminal domain-containing protein n=1 Tax=Magnetovibrio blakemorei TaxID=28181 RepID=A0A1E5Q9H9_9PROT|nr:hypothetical protein BEN30_07365 [Magnetovibrio blakemorei]